MSFEKLKRAQAIAGAETMADIVKRAVDFLLSEKDPAAKLTKPIAERKTKTEPRKEKPQNTGVTPPATARPENQSKAIPINEKRLVIKRNGWRCAYICQKTGKQCSETTSLEFDHIEPRACGRSNDHTNLRLLCRSHNLLAARQVFGGEFMDLKQKQQPMDAIEIKRDEG